jgi:dTDP-4-amino-4,6-dideoxygalactose transaminase
VRTLTHTVRFQRPSVPSAQAIERYFDLARDERWFSNSGPCWRLLRDRLAEATGCECVPVTNATLGLIVAIAAGRDRVPLERREALVPSFAFAASAQAAIWNGYEPVFVDVDRHHWHLDPRGLEQAIAERRGDVGIVIPLSSFGTPPPVEVRRQWEEICGKAGIPLIVDSAAGFGARAEDGTPVGAQGDIEVVSFHAVKPLGIGEGGAVFTREKDLAERIRRLSEFAFDERKVVTETHGINAKLSELSAAIALAALDEFGDALDARRAAAAQIVRALPPGFTPQRDHELGTWQFVPVLAPDAVTRNAVFESARGKVELRTYYAPLHAMPAFAGRRRVGDLAATEDLSSRMLSLPMAPDLTPEEIGAVVSVLRTGQD